MRGRIAVLIGTIALAVTAWAGDPWKEKNYKEWNEQDVNKILTDSPWARPITVLASWRVGGRSLPDTIGQRTGDAASPRERSGGISTDVTNAVAAEVGGPNPGTTQDARFIVRWSSARTVRQALARFAALKGASQAEFEMRLNTPVTEHQILLYGGDMAPFVKSDELSLMQGASLSLRKNKTKLSPSRVQITRDQDGKRIAGISFYFAMKTDSGEPTVTADEKGIDFECRVGTVTLKTTFEPSKMRSIASPDF